MTLMDIVQLIIFIGIPVFLIWLGLKAYSKKQSK